MSRLELQLEENGWIICADEHGIAWGEGHTNEEAVADWQAAAIEIREILRRASPALSPLMAHRLAILDHYASQRGWA